jgi:hypothetical protein
VSALRRLVVTSVVAVTVISGCSDNPTPSPTAAGSTSPSVSSSGTLQLSARERAAQLASVGPQTFDASYRLSSNGKRPNASVRMRALGDRFRLDIERGTRTAVLISSGRGVISCQTKSEGKGPSQHNCLLVAKNPANIPRLFDPQLQRLFRNTRNAVSRPHSDITVKRAGTWKPPGSLGTAECFAIHGPDVQNGTYCYLADPGPLMGLLARAVFDSGTLNLREAKRVVRPETLKPPVSPTPLP